MGGYFLPCYVEGRIQERDFGNPRTVAFIAPALVKAVVEGRLPRGIGIATLRDAPAEWSLQFGRLGLAQP